MTDLMRVIEEALTDNVLWDADDGETWEDTRSSILAALRPAVEQWMQRPLDEAAERERFEQQMSSPPYELGVERWLDDDSTWPGQYREYFVQLAWEFWLAAKRDERRQQEG
jgi:hypothetical protein